jgi:hypothetical protein
MTTNPIVTGVMTGGDGPAIDADIAGHPLDDSPRGDNRGGRNTLRAQTGFAAALLLIGLGGAALVGAPTTVAAPSIELADSTVTSTTDPSVTPTGSTPTSEAPTSTSLTRVPMTAQLTETSRVLATAVPVSPTLTVSLAPQHPTGILAQVPLRIFTPTETSPAVTTAPTAPPTRTPAPPTSTTVLATPPGTTVPAVPAPGN